ncbi:hypothetical protein ACLK1T_10705 [Escherichia coli]
MVTIAGIAAGMRNTG